jgi:hypothetical protein
MNEFLESLSRAYSGFRLSEIQSNVLYRETE